MSAERYTVVFTGLFDLKKPGEYLCLAMDDDPAESGGHRQRRGSPPYGEFGREIEYRDLPEGCRKLVLDAYAGLWGL